MSGFIGFVIGVALSVLCANFLPTAWARLVRESREEIDKLK